MICVRRRIPVSNVSKSNVRGKRLPLPQKSRSCFGNCGVVSLSLFLVAGLGLASCRGCRGEEEQAKSSTGQAVTTSPAHHEKAAGRQPPPPDLERVLGEHNAGKQPAEKRPGLYELKPGQGVPVTRGMEIDPARLPAKVKDPVRVYRTMTILKEMQKNFPPPPPAPAGQAANNPQHEAGAGGVVDETSKEQRLVKRPREGSNQRGGK